MELSRKTMLVHGTLHLKLCDVFLLCKIESLILNLASGALQGMASTAPPLDVLPLIIFYLLGLVPFFAWRLG